MIKSTILALFSCILSKFCTAQDYNRLLIGTYTNGGSHGIYVAAFNPETGALQVVDSVSAVNPSFLCLAPNGRNVYAVSETGNGRPGGVYAFDYNSETGKLKLLNAQSSEGESPCYISMDAMGRFVGVANYSGGSLALLPVDRMGMLKPAVQTIQRFGSGPLKQRQEKSHVHQAIFSPKNNFVAIADLGTDEWVAYPFKPSQHPILDTSKAKSKKMAGGAGPRLMAFHPALKRVYIIEELSGKVSVFKLKGGSLRLLQTIASDTISKQPGSAHIQISPYGRFLYTSNRASANTLTGFKIDDKTGRLSFIGSWSSGGLAPRNFTIHPSGKWLLAANQNSNEITLFSIDGQTGLLSQFPQKTVLSMPVCLIWAP